MSLIAGGAPLPLILDAIVRGVEADHPDMVCSILLVDASGQHLLHGAAPNLPAVYTQAIDGVAIGPSAGSCGTAAYTGGRIVVADIQTDPLWDAFKHLARDAGLASCWSEPILGAGNRLLGTFAMYHRTVREPTADDLGDILAAAHLAAIAIERKEALDALAISQVRAERATASAQALARDFETLFTVSQDLLGIADADGALINLNPSWETVLGYRLDQLIGTPFLDLLHPDDVESAVAVSPRLQVSGEAHDAVIRCRCADGTYKHIEFHVRASDHRVFCVGRDVTEHIQAEAELRAAKAEAEAANRAKSDFLANMSHEVRTPLNGVIGIVDALARTELSSDQREMIALIQGSGSTLERLVSDFLDVAKVEAGQLELEIREFDLEGVLRGVLEIARIRADAKGLAFRVDYGPSARGSLLGDSVRIRQIIDNLLSNAVKFTNDGEVSVRIEVLEAAAADEPTRLSVEVRDTGVGFDSTTATPFERFSQTDNTITRRFGGTGLGLTIVKALVEAMGGEIQAESRPGAGAVFSIVIPLARSLPLADYDERLAGALASGLLPDVLADIDIGRPLRILLAEDNPTNQKVVELLLAPFGVALTIVENGELAVQAFTENPFDLVLMDMQMPVMDGLAATQALRDYERNNPERARVPIAMLSANAMEHHRLAAAKAGADLHIAKPVTALALLTGIEHALATTLGDEEPVSNSA
ncbi:MAG: ATP-binding protein [Brevundimonas sp.]|uniref:ATP-binding protein n=1 Tax=Brevundimonas sp. TaxID=1871086 RepID=UPI00273441EB|nr:ATP-binding protein [Brevundimonas sp.]MDP3404089.1 ATP-binding protein [Brevundimonas sp.]